MTFQYVSHQNNVHANFKTSKLVLRNIGNSFSNTWKCPYLYVLSRPLERFISEYYLTEFDEILY